MLTDFTTSKSYTYIKNSDGVVYGLDEVCPICGCYTANGDVCRICQEGINPEINNTRSDGGF